MQQDLGRKLLEMISIGMNQPPTTLSQYLDSPEHTDNYSSSILFIRYYTHESGSLETVPKDEKDYKQPHTDSSILTLKPVSSVSGLQVLCHKTSKWVDVETGFQERSQNKFIVFAGEELTFHTKGLIPASVHRVSELNVDTHSRVSLPFQLRGDLKKFWHPKETGTNPQLKMKMISIGS